MSNTAPLSLPEFLGKLDSVKRTSTFDDLLRIVQRGARLKAQGPIGTAAGKIQRLLGGEALQAGRLVFKRSDKFEPTYNGFKRIDLVVRELMIAPPEDAAIRSVVSMMPSAENAEEVLRQIMDDPFSCSFDLRVKSLSIPAQFDLAAHGLRSKGYSDDFIMTNLGLHVLASWWNVRFNCVALAIAEVIVAIDDGTVSAVAVGPDGTTQEIRRSFLTTPDGWRLISGGYAGVERSQSLVPGASGEAEAGIYISSTAPAELIRRGPPSKLRQRDEAIRWLRDEVNRSPRVSRSRDHVREELAKAPWNIGPGTFRTVWKVAMSQAEPGHTWSDSGRKTKPSK